MRKYIEETYEEDLLNKSFGNEIINDESSSDEDNVYLTEINFSTFSELYEKSMNYIWRIWKGEQRYQWSLNRSFKPKERFIHFKNYIENRTEHYNPINEYSDFDRFMQKQFVDYGFVIEEVLSENILKKLDSLVVDNLQVIEDVLEEEKEKKDKLEWEVKELKDDAMAVDGEIKNEITQHLQLSQAYTQNELKRLSTQSSLELDLDKFLIITQLPASIENNYSDIIAWSSYDSKITHLQTFTLVYYSQIYTNESINDLDFFNDVDYKNSRQKTFDQDLIKFSKEVEKLYSEVIDTDKLSNKILNLVSDINNNSFGGDDSTFQTFWNRFVIISHCLPLK